MDDVLFLTWLKKIVHMQVSHLRLLKQYPVRYECRILNLAADKLIQLQALLAMTLYDASKQPMRTCHTQYLHQAPLSALPLANLPSTAANLPKQDDLTSVFDAFLKKLIEMNPSRKPPSEHVQTSQSHQGQRTSQASLMHS